jgi:hypothetical protein
VAELREVLFERIRSGDRDGSRRFFMCCGLG